MTVDVGAGGRAGGEPVVLSPVGEVVAALRVGLGKVGNFVAIEIVFAQGADGVLEHVGFEVFVGALELALLQAHCHRSVRFVGERVAREVFSLEGEGSAEIAVPFGECLFGDCVDQIHREAANAGAAGELKSTRDAFRVVPAFEGFEVGCVEGLSAHADAVDAPRDEKLHEVEGDGFGVGFDGEFSVRLYLVVLMERVEDSLPQLWAEERWSAAADEDGVEGFACVGGEGAEFGIEAGGEGFLAVAGVDDAVEVAVVALVEAEGDVDVERCGEVGGCVRIG